MMLSTLCTAFTSTLAYVPMIESAPKRGTVGPTLMAIFFVLACIAVSVKWTKKSHQD